MIHCVITHERAYLIYFVVEAYNRAEAKCVDIHCKCVRLSRLCVAVCNNATVVAALQYILRKQRTCVCGYSHSCLLNPEDRTLKFAYVYVVSWLRST